MFKNNLFKPCIFDKFEFIINSMLKIVFYVHERMIFNCMKNDEIKLAINFNEVLKYVICGSIMKIYLVNFTSIAYN